MAHLVEFPPVTQVERTIHNEPWVRAKAVKVAQSKYIGLPGVGVGAESDLDGWNRRSHGVLRCIHCGRKVVLGGSPGMSCGRASWIDVCFQSVCNGLLVVACAVEEYVVEGAGLCIQKWADPTPSGAGQLISFVWMSIRRD